MSDLASKLKRLNEAARGLSGVANEAELFERILDVIEKVFSRNTAAVLLLDEAGTHLRICASRGYEPRVVAAYHAPLGEGVAGKVASTGQARWVPDVSAEPGYVPGVSLAVSEMAVPLTVDGEVIGVLDVESREAALREEDMALFEAFADQAAWAMRHGRVLEKASQRARRLELQNRAARAINAIHDQETLLRRILELAHESLGFNNVAILLPDAEGKNLEVRKVLTPVGTEGLVFPIEQGITGAVFRSGKAEIVPDVSQDPRYIPSGRPGTRAEIVAPLAINGGIIGVLDAEGENVRSFDELDLEVFTSFAAQVATALRNAELVNDIEDRALRLAEITRSAHDLNTIHDSDELLGKILTAACRALGLEGAAILLADHEQKNLVLHAARGYGAAVIGKRIAIGQGVTGTVMQTGEALLIDNIAAAERYIDSGIVGGASEMAVPLRVHGELLGVLDTESTRAHAFTQNDLELFAAFANQAAVALYNAGLFRRLEKANERLKKNVDEVSRLNAELEAYAAQISRANKSLESQIKQLTMLHQAGQTITSSLDLNETLSAILRMSSELVQSSVGAIKLIDSETKELRVMAQAGVVGSDALGLHRYDLPLKIGERTIGVFELARFASEALGDDEKKMLETLASQAAIAIENARLFEDTQRIYYDTLKSLAKALEARDHYTRGHSERVAELSGRIATTLGLPPDEVALIYNSALLHDIGKIGIRDAVLLAPRQLTNEEMEIIRQHPSFGNVILGPLKFLGQVSNLVKHHHERWDGTGYPDGLMGESIPLPSRIIAVADSFDAMTSSRPYRAPRALAEAMAEIERQAGKQFDPMVVEAFLRTINNKKERP